MKHVAAFAFALVAVATAVGCDPIQSQCEHDYDCQKEIGQELEDDYVDVCVAAADGQQKTLRANTEKECENLADAYRDLATCASLLNCDDYAEFKNDTDSEHCKDQREAVADKIKLADDGQACTGIDTDS